MRSCRLCRPSRKIPTVLETRDSGNAPGDEQQVRHADASRAQVECYVISYPGHVVHRFYTVNLLNL